MHVLNISLGAVGLRWFCIKDSTQASNPEKMNADIQINADVQRFVLQRMYASIMRVYITERSESAIEGRPDPEHAGEHKAVVTTPKELAMLALVCKLWHGELQLHLKSEVAGAVAHFINVAPTQAIGLVNVDLYTAADWAGLPAVTGMLLSVYVDSREVYAIWMDRTRVNDEDDMDEPEAHELTLGCRVEKKTDDNSWFSPDLVVPAHELCLKPGNDFTEADMQVYGAWQTTTIAQVRAWLQAQYAQMTAAQMTAV